MPGSGSARSPTTIRRYCSLLIERARTVERYRPLTQDQDFFSLSGLHDMLFHVQEHHYCIAELEQSAREAGLEFVGFKLPRRLAADYRKQFPDDPRQRSLSN